MRFFQRTEKLRRITWGFCSRIYLTLPPNLEDAPSYVHYELMTRPTDDVKPTCVLKSPVQWNKIQGGKIQRNLVSWREPSKKEQSLIKFFQSPANGERKEVKVKFKEMEKNWKGRSCDGNHGHSILRELCWPYHQPDLYYKSASIKLNCCQEP